MDVSNIPPKPPDIPEYDITSALTVTLPHSQQDPTSIRVPVGMDVDSVSRKRPAEASPTNEMPTKHSRPARSKYSALDKAPFVVHVARIESEHNAGTTLHHIKFGMFLLKHNISNVLADGIKRIGRNKVAVEFKSPEDANAFLSNPVLQQNNYEAVIPQFNITRMGLVRGVPADWTDEEVMAYVNTPSGCGKVLKVCRINRKVSNDGKPEWVPTQTVVLTFDGQSLPKRVYCCYSALEVEKYIYPTVQCFNCCNFGHTQSQCRSKPRCFKCGYDHPGNGCDMNEDDVICFKCHGDHPAISRNCPEYMRQRAVKELMAEQSISYMDANKKIPASCSSYATVTKRTPYSHIPVNRPTIQTQQRPTSHRKTTYSKPRPHIPLTPGYDIQAHQELTRDYSFSPSQNGCALNQNQNQNYENESKHDYMEELVTLLAKLLSSNSIPDHVANKLQAIFHILQNGSSTRSAPVEPQEHK